MPESPGTASCNTQGLLERLLSPLSSCGVVKAHMHFKTDPFQSEIYNPLPSLQQPQYTAGNSIFLSYQVFLKHNLYKTEYHI